MLRKAFITAAIILAALMLIPAGAGAVSLPTELGEHIPESAGEYIGDEIFSMDASELSKVFTAGFFLETAVRILKEALPGAFRDFSLILGLLILSSVINAVKDTVSSDEGKRVLEFICVLCVCTAAFSFATGLFGTAEKYISEITAFTGYALPPMTALCAAGGNVAFSAASGALVTSAMVMLESLCSGTVFPLIKICLCITQASAVVESVDISGIGEFFKKLIKWLLGGVMLGLSVTLLIQGIITKSTDGVMIKGIRFAVGNTIPIIGGAVSDAMTTVTGSIKVLSSVAGAGCCAVLVITMLVPITELLLNRLLFAAGAGAASLLGLKKESKFFENLDSLLGYAIAVMAAVSVFFIIAVSVLASAAQ